MTSLTSVTTHQHPDPRRVLNHREALEAEQQEFLRTLSRARPGEVDAPVPSCAPWRVRDLVRHLAAVHRWATAMSWTTPGSPGPNEADLPDTGDLVTLYADAAATLRTSLAAPTRPCVTLVGAGDTSDWARRQLHETFVHRLDLMDALGRHPRVEDSIAADSVAADCVAEVLDTVHPRQVRLGRAPRPSFAVELRGPGGPRLLGAGPVLAVITGSDVDLARLLWRRARLDEPGFAVSGDRGAAERLLAQALTP
ncbi:MAG: maleylpyruvate isomerase family mycothiol-dependent enzyme [Janthinobacterium lividum]